MAPATTSGHFSIGRDRGALIELPLAWYSENGGQWAMNPGHDRDYALPPRAVVRRSPNDA